jgi:hypothetical protein
MLTLPQPQPHLRRLRICSIIYKNWCLICLSVQQRQDERASWDSSKAARIEASADDVSDELTSVSLIVAEGTSPTDETPPFHEKPVPLEVSETPDFKKYALESRREILRSNRCNTTSNSTTVSRKLFGGQIVTFK